MSTTPSQEFVRRLEMVMVDAPLDAEAVEETFADFGLTSTQVALEGRELLARLDTEREAAPRHRPLFTLPRLALVAGVGGLLLAAWLAGGPDRAPKESAAASSRAPRHSPATRFDPAEWDLDKGGSEDPSRGATPTATLRPGESIDGQLAVVVKGAPAAGALVRAYLRGPSDTSTKGSLWRLAGEGTTNEQGVITLAARPGRYLVVARAPGFAAARAEVVRPVGETRTVASLALTTGSRLSGRVVVRGSLAEVPLAEVALARFATLFSGDLDVPDEEVEARSTDARGAFELAGLEPGTWQLEVRAPGYATARRLVQLPRASGVTLELVPASFLEGVVLDASGNRVVAAAVSASCATASAVRASSTDTGPEGTYSLEVEPGRCRVTARAAGLSAAVGPISVGAGVTIHALELRLGAGASVSGVVKGAGASVVSNAYVELTPVGGEERVAHATSDANGNYDLHGLPPGAYDLAVFAEGFSPYVRGGIVLTQASRFAVDVALDATGSVSGTVRDRAGNPVAGAIVQAGTMWGGPFIWGTSSQVRTGADGSFRLTGLEVGHVRVNAGFKPGVWLTREFADVPSEREGRIDLVLEPGGLVTGTVTEAGGERLTGDAVVRAIPQSPFVTGADVRAAPVGADGHYDLELPPGRYSVRAMRADADPFMAPTGPAVEVEPGQHLEVPLALSVEGPVALRGRVIQPDGTPAPLATVLLTAPGWQLVATTDADGRFTARRRPGAPGPSAPDFVDVTARAGGALGRLDHVKSGQSDVVVQLQPAGTIRGQVLGLSSRAGVTVAAYPVDERSIPWLSNGGREFPDGRFELTDLPPGRVRVTATHAGQTAEKEVQLPPGAALELLLSLASSASVHGRILDEHEAPVPGAMVWYDDTSQLPTDVLGAFRFEDVPEGTHRLHVRYDARRAVDLDFSVSRGQELDIGAVRVQRK